MNFFNTELYIYIKFFISLCVMINPIGIIPIFINLTNLYTSDERNTINIKANFISFIILLGSLFFGCHILNLFNISLDSFRIAGGVLILMFAFSMMNGALLKNRLETPSKNIPSNMDKQNKSSIQDFPIIPLAIPLIAGPGAISSIIIWRTQYSSLYHLIGSSIVILFFSFFCWLILKVSPYITSMIDEIYITIINRIMGLLLLSVAIEFICSGIRTILFSYI